MLYPLMDFVSLLPSETRIIERQAVIHNGRDLLPKPYVLFRVRVDGRRIQN
jgi:hypothetical protein